jgi:hypothetical protein
VRHRAGRGGGWVGGWVGVGWRGEGRGAASGGRVTESSAGVRRTRSQRGPHPICAHKWRDGPLGMGWAVGGWGTALSCTHRRCGTPRSVPVTASAAPRSGRKVRPPLLKRPAQRGDHGLDIHGVAEPGDVHVQDGRGKGSGVGGQVCCGGVASGAQCSAPGAASGAQKRPLTTAADVARRKDAFHGIPPTVW